MILRRIGSRALCFSIIFTGFPRAFGFTISEGLHSLDFELTLSLAVLSLFLFLSSILQNFSYSSAPVPLERGKELPHGRARICEYSAG